MKKIIILLLMTALLGGCTGSPKERVSKEDPNLSIDTQDNIERKSAADLIIESLKEGEQLIFVKDNAPEILIVKVKGTEEEAPDVLADRLLDTMGRENRWEKGKVIVENAGEFFEKF